MGVRFFFIDALRKNNLKVSDIFVVFFYDIYPQALENLSKINVNLNFLATWKDILYVAPNYISKQDHKKLEGYLESIGNG